MIHYQLTKNDFFMLQKNFIENSVSEKRKSLLITIVLMLLTAFYGFALAITLLPETMSAAIILILAVGTAVVAPLLLFPFFKKVHFTIRLKLLRSIFRQESKWPRDLTLSIYENGIEVNSLHNAVNKQVRVSWKAIERVSEDETNYYLYIEATEAIIIPKRKLRETNQTTLNHLLQKYLNITL
ncbi:YcxB family protein [Exiguobacterium aestuarii]|uniref:YcxB family protein n=1 Tax=Exiguobacterium aestuarii TaxID=273527 RepID=UPI001CD6F1B7|nr:YcxB family protein [Exiguobacterium aestuarii]MCA0980872.1 YcxB family protein [Exiguobacterium aestuarii]